MCNFCTSRFAIYPRSLRRGRFISKSSITYSILRTRFRFFFFIGLICSFYSRIISLYTIYPLKKCHINSISISTKIKFTRIFIHNRRCILFTKKLISFLLSKFKEILFTKSIFNSTNDFVISITSMYSHINILPILRGHSEFRNFCFKFFFNTINCLFNIFRN